MVIIKRARNLWVSVSDIKNPGTGVRIPVDDGEKTAAQI